MTIMEQLTSLAFERNDLLAYLEQMNDIVLDEVDFGVIGFSRDGIVCRYNAYESRFTGLSRERVLGRSFFTEIAQCMNNYLVAQRFEDSGDAGVALDETLDYVLSWRMRPTKVELRMLFSPEYPLRYICIRHQNTLPEGSDCTGNWCGPGDL